MDRSESERFGMSIAALAAAFNREIDQATLQAYRWGTDGMTVEAIERACIQAIRESKFMPTPAELRELGGEISQKSIGLLAWESFTQADRKHGSYTSVDFDDRTINAVIRNLGGWLEITLLEGEEYYKWLRHRFIDAYEKLSRLNLSGEIVGPLIGIHDISNRSNGYEISKPILIECLSTPKTEPKQIEESVQAQHFLGEPEIEKENQL